MFGASDDIDQWWIIIIFTKGMEFNEKWYLTDTFSILVFNRDNTIYVIICEAAAIVFQLEMH